jgi:hypothetical protein
LASSFFHPFPGLGFGRLNRAMIIDEYDDDNLYELRQEDRAYRARVAQRCAHPDFRDPDYEPDDPELDD